MSTLKWGRVGELGLTWQRRRLLLEVTFTQGRDDGNCNPRYELRGNETDCCCNPAAPPCIVMGGATAIAIATQQILPSLRFERTASSSAHNQPTISKHKHSRTTTPQTQMSHYQPK